MRIARLNIGLILALVSVYLPAQQPVQKITVIGSSFGQWL